ncbi:male genitalia morphogenesis [Branchiostoma belcheri]|nr:male genitalia morphogenesis [Branchiostoma belcheri]
MSPWRAHAVRPRQWPGMRVPQSLRSGVDAGPDCPDTMFKVCGNTQPTKKQTNRRNDEFTSQCSDKEASKPGVDGAKSSPRKCTVPVVRFVIVCGAPVSSARVESYLDNAEGNGPQDCSKRLMDRLHYLTKKELDAQNYQHVTQLLHLVQVIAGFTDFDEGLPVLLDNKLPDMIRRRAMLTILAVPLAKFLCETKADFGLRLEAGRTLNVLLQGITSSIRHEYKASPGMKAVMKNLAALIQGAGDFELQITTLEALFRMMSRTDRGTVAREWFPDPAVNSAMLHIRDSDFETLHQPADDNLTDFWVDFNTSSHSISLFVVDKNNTDQDEADGWETVVIKSPDVKFYMLSECMGDIRLEMVLLRPACDISEVCAESNRDKTAIFVLKKSPDISRALDLSLGKGKERQKVCAEFYNDTLDVGYADDVGLSRSIPCRSCGVDNTMSAEALQLDTWAGQNDMILNGKKSQQLQICFSRNIPVPPPLSLGGELVPVTTTAKGLGFTFDSTLSWQAHVKSAVSKASSRLHYLRLLTKQGMSVADLVQVYLSLIRPILEYGHVLLVGCSDELSTSMERVQKRAVRIISLGGKRTVPKLPSLKERREAAALKLFTAMIKPEHPLHDLVPPQRSTATGPTLSDLTMEAVVKPALVSSFSQPHVSVAGTPVRFSTCAAADSSVMEDDDIQSQLGKPPQPRTGQKHVSTKGKVSVPAQTMASHFTSPVQVSGSSAKPDKQKTENQCSVTSSTPRTPVGKNTGAVQKKKVKTPLQMVTSGQVSSSQRSGVKVSVPLTFIRLGSSQERRQQTEPDRSNTNDDTDEVVPSSCPMEDNMAVPDSQISQTENNASEATRDNADSIEAIDPDQALYIKARLRASDSPALSTVTERTESSRASTHSPPSAKQRTAISMEPISEEQILPAKNDKVSKQQKDKTAKPPKKKAKVSGTEVPSSQAEVEPVRRRPRRAAAQAALSQFQHLSQDVVIPDSQPIEPLPKPGKGRGMAAGAKKTSTSIQARGTQRSPYDFCGRDDIPLEGRTDETSMETVIPDSQPSQPPVSRRQDGKDQSKLGMKKTEGLSSRNQGKQKTQSQVKKAPRLAKSAYSPLSQDSALDFKMTQRPSQQPSGRKTMKENSAWDDFGSPRSIESMDSSIYDFKEDDQFSFQASGKQSSKAKPQKNAPKGKASQKPKPRVPGKKKAQGDSTSSCGAILKFFTSRNKKTPGGLSQEEDNSPEGFRSTSDSDNRRSTSPEEQKRSGHGAKEGKTGKKVTGGIGESHLEINYMEDNFGFDFDEVEQPKAAPKAKKNENKQSKHNSAVLSDSDAPLKKKPRKKPTGEEGVIETQMEDEESDVELMREADVPSPMVTGFFPSPPEEDRNGEREDKDDRKETTISFSKETFYGSNKKQKLPSSTSISKQSKVSDSRKVQKEKEEMLEKVTKLAEKYTKKMQEREEARARQPSDSVHIEEYQSQPVQDMSPSLESDSTRRPASHSASTSPKESDAYGVDDGKKVQQGPSIFDTTDEDDSRTERSWLLSKSKQKPKPQINHQYGKDKMTSKPKLHWDHETESTTSSWTPYNAREKATQKERMKPKKGGKANKQPKKAGKGASHEDPPDTFGFEDDSLPSLEIERTKTFTTASSWAEEKGEMAAKKKRGRRVRSDKQVYKEDSDSDIDNDNYDNLKHKASTPKSPVDKRRKSKSSASHSNSHITASDKETLESWNKEEHMKVSKQMATSRRFLDAVHVEIFKTPKQPTAHRNAAPHKKKGYKELKVNVNKTPTPKALKSGSGKEMAKAKSSRGLDLNSSFDPDRWVDSDVPGFLSDSQSDGQSGYLSESSVVPGFLSGNESGFLTEEDNEVVHNELSSILPSGTCLASSNVTEDNVPASPCLSVITHISSVKSHFTGSHKASDKMSISYEADEEDHADGKSTSPSTTVRPSASTLKRKYGSDSEDDDFPPVSLGLQDMGGGRITLHPMKTIKKSLPAPTLSLNTSEVSDGDLNMTGDSMEDSLTPPEDVGLGGVLNSFNAQIMKNIQHKKKQLDSFSRNTLKSTQKEVKGLWKGQMGRRMRVQEDFKGNLLHELDFLEKEMANLQACEEKALKLFENQQKLLSTARITHEQRFRKIVQMEEDFHKTLAELDREQEQQQISLRENLCAKAQEMSNNFLKNIQQEEMKNMRKVLHNMFL